MNARILLCGCILCAAFLWGCSKGEESKEKTVLRINDYTIAESEFKKRMAEEVRYYDNINVNQDMINMFVDQLIRKELLIQEAVKLKLDRNEKFTRAIERFWENTLIRDMIEAKGQEISGQTVVTQEEISRAYAELLKTNPAAPPEAQMAEALKKRILDEKKTAALEEWITSLRKNADVTVTLDAAQAR